MSRNVDLPINRTRKETEALIDEIIDVFFYGRFDCYQDMLDSDRHASCSEVSRNLERRTWETSTDALHLALVTSAIIHGDAAELESIYLNTGIWITTQSVRFKVVPMEVAAQMGSEDVIRTIINCWGPIGARDPIWGCILNSGAVVTSARAGNLKATELFTKFLKAHNYYAYSLDLATLCPSRVGKIDSMHYCLEQNRDSYGYHDQLFNSFISTVKYGQVDAAKYLLDRGELDIKAKSSYGQKGLLLTVLHDCS
ncbi:hypothetical protein N7507_002387 [Penicillium longicatenatum]|nr:hypothetical protein N7507_002387 [Penicillium longicatenatum]